MFVRSDRSSRFQRTRTGTEKRTADGAGRRGVVRTGRPSPKRRLFAINLNTNEKRRRRAEIDGRSRFNICSHVEQSMPPRAAVRLRAVERRTDIVTAPCTNRHIRHPYRSGLISQSDSSWPALPTRIHFIRFDILQARWTYRPCLFDLLTPLQVDAILKKVVDTCNSFVNM